MFKNKDKADVIFLIVIFILLFIPMLHIDKSTYKERENRKLATYSSFIKENNKINKKYSRDLEKYITDRFFGRMLAVNIYCLIRFTLSDRSKSGFIDKKTGIMYLKNEYTMPELSKIKKGLDGISELNDFCRANKIKLYVLIVPQKSVIYYSPKIHDIKQAEINKEFKNYVYKVNAEGKYKIVYLDEEMLEAKKYNYMFFKTDHHWTDDGAFTGYSSVMKYIKNDFPNVKVVKNSDFDYFENKLIRREFHREFKVGRTYEMLGFPHCLRYFYHRTPYRYYRHKNYLKLKRIYNYKFLDHSKKFRYSEGSDLRVLLIGTSNNENLTEILPYSFKSVEYIRTNNVKGMNDKDKYKYMKYYKRKILTYHPDIMILCVTYGNIAGLKDMFNEE